MRIGDAHLTYCTNIHPGESWAEVRHNIERHVLDVKARISPDQHFGIGLRLSAAAARELVQREPLAAFRDWLAAHDLYVFTINGFPYGVFHGQPVKEEVYRPDWLEPERLAYTNELADILCTVLPDGIAGSISTVPGCFRARADANARGVIARRIALHARYLADLESRTGKHVTLALEPEPCCLLETIAETVVFFTEELFAQSEPAVRRHVGVCLDACHAAVEFEDLAAAVSALHAAGIPIAKIQLSAGLQVAPVDAAARRALAAFAEPVYLHQVVARRAAGFDRHLDLRDALAASSHADEWRIHFHVPIVREELGPFRSTQRFLAELLALHRRAPQSAHLEVETYTWDVLPPEYRCENVADAIARELAWVIERLR